MSDLRADLLAWCDERLKVCEGATPGPWMDLGGDANMIYTVGSPYGHGQMHVADVRGWGHLTGRGACAMEEAPALEIQRANAEVILLSRTALPLLLAAVREEVEAHNTDIRKGRCQECVDFPDDPCPAIRRLHVALLKEGD